MKGKAMITKAVKRAVAVLCVVVMLMTETSSVSMGAEWDSSSEEALLLGDAGKEETAAAEQAAPAAQENENQPTEAPAEETEPVQQPSAEEAPAAVVTEAAEPTEEAAPAVTEVPQEEAPVITPVSTEPAQTEPTQTEAPAAQTEPSQADVPAAAPAEESADAGKTEGTTAPAAEPQTTPAAETKTTPAAEAQTTPAAETKTTPAAEAQTTPAAGTRTTPAAGTKTTPAAKSETTAAAGRGAASSKNNTASTSAGAATTTKDAAASGEKDVGMSSQAQAVDIMSMGKVTELNGSVTEAEFKARVNDGTATAYQWTADSNCVSLTNATTDTVTVKPVAGKKGGTVTITLEVTLEGGDSPAEATKKITVYTARAFTPSLSATDHKATKKENVTTATVGDTLTLEMAAVTGSEATDSTPGDYKLQWQTRNTETESWVNISDATSASYKPATKGFYRVLVSRAKDDVNYRLAYQETEVGPVLVSALDVTVEWEKFTKEYDGKSTVEYSGSAAVKRTDGTAVSGLQPTASSYEITLSGADADTYNAAFYPAHGLSADSYNVTGQSLSVVITALDVPVTITPKDKNFDNTTALKEVPEVAISSDFTGGTLSLLVNDTAPAASDFAYASAGSVDEDTEASIELVGEKTLSMAVDGSQNANLTPNVTYGKATIKKNEFTQENAVSKVTGGFLNKETYWVKKDGNDTIAVTAADGYTISDAIAGTYAASANAVKDTESGKYSVFAANAAGEIGRVKLDNVKIDKTPPTVTLQESDTILFQNKNLKNTYKIADAESGLAKVAYYVTEADTEPAYDESTWTPVTLPTEGDSVEATLVVPKKGKVYIYAADQLGNSVIKYHSTVVLEKEAPQEFTLTPDNTNCTKTHEVTLYATDLPSPGFSGISRIEYALLDSETATDVAGSEGIEVAVSGTGLKKDTNSNAVVRETDPTDIAAVNSAESMTAKLTFSGDLNGTYILKATAYDYCGKGSAEAETSLIFDNTAPKVTVASAGEYKKDDKVYYGIADKSITVTFKDTNLAAGGTYEATVTNGETPLKKTLTPSGREGEIVFSKEDLATLDDGAYTLTVKAVDASGNDADGKFKLGEETLDAYEFTVDQTKPAVTEVAITTDTDCKITKKEADGTHSDRYLFSKPFSVKVTIADNNVDKDSFTAAASTIDSTEAPTIEISDTGLEVTYTLAKDSEDKEVASKFVPAITGKDFAGNDLELAAAIKYVISTTDSYTWKANTDNTGVESAYELWYQAEVPEIDLSYTKEGEYLPEENISGQAAYYNKDITVTAALKNLAADDDYEGISLTVKKTLAGETTPVEKTFTLKELADGGFIAEDVLTLTLPLDKTLDNDVADDENAAYQLSFKGNNVYGNPVVIKETDPKGEAPDDTEVTFTEDTPYEAAWTVVHDTKAPKALVTVKPAEGVAKKDLNSIGNRYYFNGNADSTVIVKDYYLDDTASTITVLKAENSTADNFSTVTFDKDGFDAENPCSGTFTAADAQATWPTSQQSEGVYAYAVYGCDLAGNPLELDTDAKFETATIDFEEKAAGGGSDGGSGTDDPDPTKQAYVTLPVVIDKTAPVGTIKIYDKKDGTLHYAKTTGNDVDPAQVYIMNDAAYVTAGVNKAEKLPVTMSLSVNKKNGTKNVTVSVDDPTFRAATNHAVDGEQIFTVSAFTVTDLAGNPSPIMVETDKIYVDKSKPTEDTFEPTITITATVPNNNYSNDGMPLFDGDADFKVVVTEPWSSAVGTAVADYASSGLKDVSYALYSVNQEGGLSDEALTTGNLYTYVAANGYSYKYAADTAITISSAKYNRNDLAVKVTAKDNSGNTSSRVVRFGIDTTDPVVKVKYDNNDVKNSRYFQKDRTATITVTERNFMASEVQILTSKNMEGEIEESDWKYKKGSKANGDDDTYTKKIKFSGDGDFTFQITDLADAAGRNAALTDIADGEKAPWDFTIDKNAPKVVVTMGGNPYSKDDPNFYYRADNGGITVTFNDHGHDMGVVGNDPTPVYKVTIDNKHEKSFVPAGTATTEEVLTYTAEEVAAFGDGEHTIEVTAIDIAGRETEKLDDSSEGCIFTDMTGKFILDTTAPAVTVIETAPKGEGTATDNKIYTDTNSVYYNQAVDVIITVEDAYMDKSDFFGRMKVNASEVKTAEIKDVANKDAITLTYAMEGNNKYSGLDMLGYDKAGNRLVLDGSYKHKAVDALTDDNKGSVSADHGKVIDIDKPVLTIRYESDDYANLYKGETKGKTSAYYNKDITVTIGVTDNYELDGDKLIIGREDNKKAAKVTVAVNEETNISETSYDHPAVSITKDGRYSYTGYGTDRALNPVVVMEQIPRTDSSHVEKFEQTTTTLTDKNTGKVYAAKYELVLDKTAPTFVMTVSSPKATNKGLNEQGNRYYFNSNYSTTITVTDTNVDLDKLTVKSGYSAGATYDSSTVKISTFGNAVGGKNRSGKAVFSDSQSNDGVYRYAIWGSDKAGNALVPGKTENLDGTSKNPVDADTEKGRGSLERTADTSNHIVIDKVKPSSTYYVAEGSTDYFIFDSNGNTSLSVPFRDETSANLRVVVDEKVEHTPVKVQYDIAAQPTSSSNTVTTKGFVYNPTVKSTQSGRQQFKMDKLVMTDLAGNETTASSRNYIYLDELQASLDIIPPTVQIVATASSDTRGGHGQPLYKDSVTLQVRVTDPYPNESSSGIADVSADIYVNGSLVSDTRKLHEADTKEYAANYTDPELLYSQTWEVTLASGQYNYNDLRVVAHATDNAGNVSTDAQYEFGIDITPPVISVSYDNNDVRNGKYFKADRTATVVVTERNFDASRISISTESAASVSGWSHASGSDSNGDNDTWTATVNYTVDGPYTLNVSGADQLGWAASSISYSGEAPQDFVLDKTAPVVDVEFDNNDVRNNKYYNADRKATITVTDVNFDGEWDITVTEVNGGDVPTATYSGNEAYLEFTGADNVYTISGTVTDQAGNVSDIFKVEEFVVDKTIPELTITGVEDLSANRDPLDIVIMLLDTNLVEESIVAELEGYNNGPVDISGLRERVDGGVQYVLNTLDEDDYYKLIVTGTDLAGNSKSETRSFSVNQFGSVFEFLQRDELNNGYSNKSFKPSIKIHNVDEVTVLSVTLNGQETNYEYKNDILTLTDPIDKDGKYTINVETTDAAGNYNDMKPVEFYLDTKAPVISQSGLEILRNSDYKRVYSDPFDLRIIHDFPEDSFVQVKLNDRELGTDEFVVDGDAIIIPVNEYMDYKVEVAVSDTAGNTSIAEWTFELTKNPIKIWYSNKPVFYGSLGGFGLLLLLLLVLLKRR